jgi:hypothetical protein
MTKKLIPFLLFALQMSNANAQDLTVPFGFQPPKYTPHKSLYSHIDFLDSRADKFIGPIAAGALRNRDGFLVLKLPVQPELADILRELTDSATGDGEMLFQLRRFKYVEAYSTQYCFFCATLYAKTAGRYQKLMTLDTTFILANDKTKKPLTKMTSTVVADFLTEALLLQPADPTSYGSDEIARIDSIEKSRLRLYTDTNLVDGLYTSYTSFSLQRPDLQCTVKTKRNKDIDRVYFIDADGENKERKPRDVYAVVYKGMPFIATEYGYYPIQRIDNDLYFTGDLRIAASMSDLASAQFGMGLLGRYIAGKGLRTTYRLQLDHISGDFVHLWAIKNTDPNAN